MRSDGQMPCLAMWPVVAGKYGVFSPGHGPFGHPRSALTKGASPRHGGENVKWERSYDVGPIRRSAGASAMVGPPSMSGPVILRIISIAYRMIMIFSSL